MQVVESIERKPRFVPIGKIETIKKPALEPIGPEPAPVITKAGVAGNYRFDIRNRLSAEEEFKLWHAWKVDGDITARNLILRCHLHHVVQIAYLFPKCGHPIEALIAEGNFGCASSLTQPGGSRHQSRNTSRSPAPFLVKNSFVARIYTSYVESSSGLET
jgi:hypothetical protein